MVEVSVAKDRNVDIALNIESARKTEVAVSFAGQTRIYASGAIGHVNQNKVGAFSYAKRFLGADANVHGTEDLSSLLGMEKRFYDYQVI